MYTDDGVRISKTTSSDTTIFIGNYTELRGSDVIRYIYADRKQIASIDELNQIAYSHGDHLNSSNLRTDSVGNIVKRIEYQPFGAKRIDVGSYSTIKQGFTGQYNDDESDLYYFQKRYYDPNLARFISADPLYIEEMDKRGVDSQELGVYVYTRNNPVNLVDPDGQGALFGAVFAAAVDLSVQLYVSKDRAAMFDPSRDLGKTAGSMALAFAGGFTGAGAAAVIEKQMIRLGFNGIARVALGATANGTANAFLSTAQTITTNAAKNENKNLGDSFVNGFIFGAAGNLAERGLKSIFNSASNNVWNNTSLSQKIESTVLLPENIVTGNGTSAAESLGNGVNSIPAFFDIFQGSNNNNITEPK